MAESKSASELLPGDRWIEDRQRVTMVEALPYHGPHTIVRLKVATDDGVPIVLDLYAVNRRELLS
jgi:hypothetical protein